MIKLLVCNKIIIVFLNILDLNLGRQKLTKLVVMIKVVELSSVHHLYTCTCIFVHDCMFNTNIENREYILCFM